MSVTLRDIARHTGKSIATVSRALAGFADISPHTRQEVQRVAAELGYEPHTAARNLQQQRTNSLALILPTTRNLRFSDPFFAEFLSGVVERAAALGFDVHVSADVPGDELGTYLRHIRRRSADGYIIVRTQRHDDRIQLLQAHQVPFVAFGRVEGANDFHLVDEDGACGMRQVVDHLVALGHTHLACIAEPLTYTKAYNRVQGFLDGLRAHGLPAPTGVLVESNFRQRSGRLSAEQLLNRPDPPTAIVACNDLLALGAVSAAQARGLVVGQDVSITGFDDIPMAELAHPPLTTVHQPAHRFGTAVATMLCAIIKGEPIEPKQIIVQPTLVPRQSTGSRRCAVSPRPQPQPLTDGSRR